MNQANIDLCEEGVGLGVPILQCTRDFFFPGTAIAEPVGEVREGVAKKIFILDLINRIQAETRRVHKFTWVYSRLLNRTFKSVIGRRILLRYFKSIVGQKILKFTYNAPKFIRVSDHGQASCIYLIDTKHHRINITINFSGIHKHNLQKIYVSNELGGHVFTHYRDSSNIRLRENQIGEWNKIHASWAMFYSPRMELGFLVDIPSGIEAFRGREANSPELCWSGIILSLPPSIKELQYTITLGTTQELNEVVRSYD